LILREEGLHGHGQRDDFCGAEEHDGSKARDTFAERQAKDE
jgi:hypothetical protein